MQLTQQGEARITLVQRKPSAFNRRVGTRYVPPTPKTGETHTLNKSEIAELSRTAIDQMTAVELVMVIRGADLPMLPESQTGHHLQDNDLQTLRLLAYLARFSCHNQCQGC